MVRSNRIKIFPPSFTFKIHFHAPDARSSAPELQQIDHQIFTPRDSRPALHS
jgi:hypothetical protein